jgi:WD40 repeat protein
MTYQGAVDVDSIVDPVEKQSTISQINNFGQTPLQLFTKPHAQRRVLPSTRATISSVYFYGVFFNLLSQQSCVDDCIIACIQHPKLLTGKPVHRLSGGKVSSLFFHTSTQPDTVASPLSSPLASTLSTSLTAAPSAPAATTSPDVAIISLPSASLLALAGSKGLIAPKFNKFLSWGFADRSLRVCILQVLSSIYLFKYNCVHVLIYLFLTQPSVRYPTQGEPIAIHEQLHDNSQISCATVTDDGRTIVLGSQGAMLSIWRRHEVHKYRQLTFVGTLCQHTDEVTCLTTSTSLRLLVSGGKDKQVLVWDLNRMQLVCRLSENAHTQPVWGKNISFYIRFTFIFCFLTHWGYVQISAVAIDAHHGEIVSAAGSDLFVWTVNGRALAHTRLDGVDSAILSVAVGKEPTGVIVTGHQDGSIRFFAVHYDHGRTRAEPMGACPENGARLLQLHCIEKAHSAPVTCLHTSAHGTHNLIFSN